MNTISEKAPLLTQKQQENAAKMGISEQEMARRVKNVDKAKQFVGRWARRGAVAGALSAAVIAGSERLASDTKPNSDNEKTVDYVVQPGDTLWGVAEKIEANQDSIKGNQSVRNIKVGLVEQSKQDGQPGVRVGEVLQIPESADIYADIDGAQLDNK